MSEKKAREERQDQKSEEAKNTWMIEHHKVFKCSGMLEHLQSCDGKCEMIDLTPLEIALNEERQRWTELGMIVAGVPDIHRHLGQNIPGIPVDIFHLEVSMGSLVDFLCEKGFIVKDELNEYFQKIMLERLTAIREANQDAIREAKQRSEIAIGNILPQIEVPDYIKRRMH